MADNETPKTDATRRWHQEHVNFARLLDLLEDFMGQFHAGGSPDFACAADIVLYLRDFGDASHHPREDVAFECMVRSDPTLRLPVNRLLQEHRAIRVSGEQLEQQLQQVVAGTSVAHKVVETAAALYLCYYRHHLASEELQILPRASQLLSAEDWRRVARAAPATPDPLFGPTPDPRWHNLRETLDRRQAGPVAAQPA